MSTHKSTNSIKGVYPVLFQVEQSTQQVHAFSYTRACTAAEDARKDPRPEQKSKSIPENIYWGVNYRKTKQRLKGVQTAENQANSNQSSQWL